MSARRRQKYLYATAHYDPMFGHRVWTRRYDSIDVRMGRPVHADMSVAPPWARRITNPEWHAKIVILFRRKKKKHL